MGPVPAVDPGVIKRHQTERTKKQLLWFNGEAMIIFRCSTVFCLLLKMLDNIREMSKVWFLSWRLHRFPVAHYVFVERILKIPIYCVKSVKRDLMCSSVLDSF